MFVMTATTGVSSRKERSYSSASATRKSPFPRRAFVPRMRTRPPTRIVGSKPASVRTIPVSDVVVVFPWVPAMATPCFKRMISPSISARRITGIPRSRAAATSGLDSLTAEEMTTRSASRTCFASCPYAMRAPSLVSRSVFSERARSHPEISSGVERRRISASALMPTPPAPTKCSRRCRRNLTAALLPSRLEEEIREPRRGVGHGERARIAAHLGEMPAVGDEPPDRLRQRRPVQLALLDRHRRARRAERPRVHELVSMRRGRERDEDRRASRRGELRERHRARAADDEVAPAAAAPTTSGGSVPASSPRNGP